MKIKPILLTAALAIPTIASAQPNPTPSTESPQPTETPQPPPTDPATDTKTGDKAKGAAKLSNDEVMIVAHLHHVNAMEIAMGKTAKLKGTAAVKKLADMLIKDHGTADKALTAMTKKKSLKKIPAAKPETQVEKQEMQEMMDTMAAMKKLKGADFDREFLRINVEGHDKELAKTDVFLTSATDPDLKSILETRKTTLRRHADMAKQLQAGHAQASAPPQPVPKTTK